MTTQKIDRNKRIDDLVDSLLNISNNTNLSTKSKHVKFSRLCLNERRFLGAGQTEKQAGQDDNPITYKIAASTYLSYLTDFRNAILSLNELNLLARNKIISIQKSYPDIDLSGLDASLPELRNNVKKILENENVRNCASLLRKLDKLRIEHHAYYCMRPDANVLDRVHADNKDNLFSKHTSQKVVSRVRIDEVFKALVRSNHWVDLTIYAALATGRRAVEVLQVGKFDKAKRGFLSFEGQAKTKTRDTVGAFVIPCLVSVPAFLKNHDRLKVRLETKAFYGKPFKSLSNDEINGATAGRLNKAVKKLFGDEFTFKDLRAIYAKVASVKHHQPRNKTLAAFYSEILGHDDKDIATQLSYQGIVLVDEDTSDLKPIELTTDKPKVDNSNQLSLKKLVGFDGLIEEQRGAAVKRVHEFVKSVIEKDSSIVITQSFLCRLKSKGGVAGFSRPAVKSYLKLVGFSK